MHLEVIGGSPAWPNPGQAHAGYLVESGSGERLLLDCGPGVLSCLRERELLPLDAIVVTHLHLDHWGDLVPWCWFQKDFPETAGRPQLWLPPGARDALETFAATFGSDGMFASAFELHEYRPEAPFSVGELVLEAVPVAHYGVPSFGLRVAAEAVVAYSGDSAPCETLRSLARGADLFICEATLAAGRDDGEPRGHMSAEEAIELAGETRLLLTHRPIELDRPAAAQIATPGLRIEL